MKTSLLLLAFAAVSLPGWAQHGSCCMALGEEAHANFANNAADPAFAAMHETPRPVPTPVGGEMISYSTPDGQNAKAYYVASPRKSYRYLIMIHEWWGLNDNIKREAELWREKLGDVNVIAVDLYDGTVATTREAASAAMQGLNAERAVSILRGTITYAGPNAVFATIGWCMGGGWSHQASLLAGINAKACAIYYGSPELDAERLKREQYAPVIFIWPTKDQWINEKLVKGFEGAMTQAGKSLVVKSYEADHAFANPSSQSYLEAASQEANAAVLAFFQTHFR